MVFNSVFQEEALVKKSEQSELTGAAEPAEPAEPAQEESKAEPPAEEQPQTNLNGYAASYQKITAAKTKTLWTDGLKVMSSKLNFFSYFMSTT